MRDKILLAFILCSIMNPRLEILFAQPSNPLKVVWEDSATDISGRISHDGKWLSYTDGETGNLHVREMSTGKILSIAKGPGDWTEYAGTSFFSPESDRVAFQWYDVQTSKIKIAALSADSTQFPVIEAGLLDWLPDGNRLLVYREGELGYVQIKTGEFESLLKVQDPVQRARVSPDGKFVAFSLPGADPTKYEIRIISTENGTQSPFISGGGDHQSPVWSLDGKSMLYFSDREGTPRLWRKSLSDQDPKQGGEAIADLPDAAVLMLGLDASGTVYLGTYDRGGQDVYYGMVDWEKKSVDHLNMTPSPPFHGSRRAVFALSGDKIAYMRKGRGFIVRPGWQTPVVRSLANGVERAYPTHLTLRDEPLWAPNGHTLYFAAPPERAFGESAGLKWSFYGLNLDNGSYSELGSLETAGLVRMAGITSDSIICLVNTFGVPTYGSIFSFEVSSGKNALIYRIENNSLSDAALSPDGSRLALVINAADGNRALHVLLRGEKKPTPIATIRPNARAQLMWLPSGDAIVTSGRIKGKQGIWRVPIDGSPPQALNIPADNVTEVRLSTDGRRIAFTRSNQLPRQILALNGVY